MQISSIPNFTELFSEERDIWIKKLVPGVVSLQFRLPDGGVDRYRVESNDPECLSNYVPFDAIRNSKDLKMLAGPRRLNGGVKPPAIRIMTVDEVNQHFAKKAERRGYWAVDADGNVVRDEKGNKVPDVTKAMTPQYTQTDEHVKRTRIEPTPQVEDAGTPVANLGKEGQIRIVDTINPRVQWMLNELNTADSETSKMLADDLIDEFELLEPLSQETLKHIMTDGHYSTVKRWAQSRLVVEDDE